MSKPFFLRAVRLLGTLALGWLLSGANLWAVQANPAGVSRLAPTAGSIIYIPRVVNGSSTQTGSTDPLILAAGDIAKCTSSGDEGTAAVIQRISGTVLTLGDNAYDSGTPQEYATCYDPSWGAFKNRTKSVPGNHEYLTSGASGYYAYFGAAAGDPTKGYYSYNLGSWHILAINSNCVSVGGCNTNSPQEKWVKADLAASKAKCVLAYWHHPFYSSGASGDTPQMAAIWTDLYNAGAEIVLSGHVHAYERFAPQNPTAGLDPARGIVQFVVGTGGGNFTPLVVPHQPNSLASAESIYGVLQLTLHASSYTWQFLPAAGFSYKDAGTANCH